jgi:SM-20-related protein
MTPKQILDSFSETLMQDERILSAQERALLATLLQHAKSVTSGNQDTRQAVSAVIASGVGETVAQRAFAVLGGSIVERILENAPWPQVDSLGARATEYAGPKNPKEPDPPAVRAPQKPLRDTPVPSPGPKEPDPPGVRAPHKPLRDTPVPPGPKEPDPPGVRAPGKPMRDTPVPSPGTPRDPEPPSHGARTTVVSETRVLVDERPPVLAARCVVLDEFLAPAELADLTRFVEEHENDFKTSEVVSPRADNGVVNYEHRRSRVLMDVGRHQDVILQRIKSALPQVLDALGMEEFTIADVEVQATASNDGDFFHFHSDNGSERVAARHLTFVYFFHREPRQFEGGELRIHDSRLEEGVYVSDGRYHGIVPQQNQIVFFPCEMLHEITAVDCASQRFADSRFTLNGWLRR